MHYTVSNTTKQFQITENVRDKQFMNALSGQGSAFFTRILLKTTT